MLLPLIYSKKNALLTKKENESILQKAEPETVECINGTDASQLRNLFVPTAELPRTRLQCMNEQSVWLTETQTVINAGNFRLGIIPGESFLTSHVSCVFISDELHTYWIVFLIFNVSSVVFRLPVIFFALQ